MDIAQLGISVDSTSAVQAAGALDNLTASATNAASANERLAGSAGSAAAAQTASSTAASSAAASTSSATTAADRLIASLEKQIILFNATDATIALYTANVAKMTAAESAHYQAQSAVLSQLQAESVQLAQFYAAQEAAAAAGDKFIASLTTQAETIGLSKTQLLEYKAAQLGVSDAAAPLIASIEAQTAALAGQSAATVVAGETAEAATLRFQAIAAAGLEWAAAQSESVAISAKYAESIDAVAAAATAAELAGQSLNATTVKTAEAQNATAAATERAAAADDAYNAAVTRTTAALERKLFSLTATNTQMVEYDARLAGATEEEVAYQVALTRSIEETTAQVAASKAAAAALGEQATAAGTAALATSTVTREVVTMGREIGRGDISRLAGSTSLLAQNLGLLDKLFTPLGLAIGGFALSVGISADAADKAAKNLSAYGEEVTKIQEATGASTDFIQAFNYAVEATGGKAGEGGTALDHLTLQIGKAEEGSKRAQETFASVGITLNDLKTLSPDQVMGKLADAFANTQDNAAKFVISQQLVGSSSRDLIDVLDQGSAGLAAYGDQAQKVGAILSDSVIAQSKQLHDQMATAKADWDALVTTAETALLPTLLAVTKGLHDNGAEADAVKGFFEGVNEVFKLTAAAAATVGTGLNQIAELLVTAGTAAVFVVKGQFQEANAAIVNGWQNVQKEGNSYADFVTGLYKKIATPPPETVIQTQSLTAPQFGRTKAGPNVPGAQENQELKGLQDQFKLIEDAYKNHQKALDDDRRAGIIADASYYAQEQALNDQNLKDILDNYAKQIAVLKEGTPGENAKQRIDDQTKINTLQAEATKAINDYLATYSKLTSEEVADTSKRTAAIKDYNDRLQEQLDTQKNAADLQVASLSQGSRESGLAAQINAAQKAYDSAAVGIQRTFDRSKQTPDDKAQYDSQLAAQKAYENQVIALDQNTYDRITAAQEDWLGGAKKAWADWADSADNFSSQAGTTVTDALNGMTDALTTFATTGKLSFTSLADSIIKDLIRIAVQAAESQAIGAILGLVSGGAGTVATGALGAVNSSAGGGTAGGSVFAATGGFITGPGSGTSDSINAKLSNGEFVVNAAATAANRPMLEALNGGKGSSGQTHFATGGFVGSAPSSVSGGSTSIVFNISNPSSSGAATGQPGTSTTGQKAKSDSFQKELESAVLEVVRKHSEPGGQVNKIIKQVVTS